MSDVKLFCEGCGKFTAHTVSPFAVNSPAPIATDKAVDLTGREGIPWLPQTSLTHVPQAMKYTCMVCGHESVIVGNPKDVKKDQSQDVFARLKQGKE